MFRKCLLLQAKFWSRTIQPVESNSASTSTHCNDKNCWCGNARATTLFTLVLHDGLNLKVCQCSNCGVQFLNPQPTDHQLLPYYDTPYYGSSPEKFVGPIARLVRKWQAQRAAIVARRIDPPQHVLDVGCGNGQFLLDLHNIGFKVQGTELSGQSAARVPKPIAGNIHVGDLCKLNLSPESYDAICMWHVLEHVPDPFAVCCEIYRLLKTDGWLFLSLPNTQSPEAALFGKHWFHLDPPRHLFGLGTQSLTTLLEAAGFEVLKVNTWSLEQNPYGFMQSCLNAMGFKRDRAYDTLKGMHKGKFISNAIDVLLLAMLTLPGVCWSSVLSCLGKGSTMTFVVRKR